MEAVHPLKAFRDRQDPPLTQEQLAVLLGVSKASVSRWETGERKPELALLDGITAHTGIPAAELRPDLAGLFSGKSAGSSRTRRAPARRSRAA